MTVQSNPARSLFSRLHFEQRIEQPRWLTWLTPVILVVTALLIGAILLQLAGANPWLVYRNMAQIAFGDLYGLSDTTIKATPLILGWIRGIACLSYEVVEYRGRRSTLPGCIYGEWCCVALVASRNTQSAHVDCDGACGGSGWRTLGADPRLAEGQAQCQRDYHLADAQLCGDSME